MDTVLEQIRDVGLMPVIKLKDPKKAVKLANALKQGGIPVAEVTFRTAGAKDAIAAIAKEVPDMLVGAGTVINIRQAQEAIEAGAKYIVSPGFVPEVVKYCIDNKVTVIPGCTNASEVSEAANLGLKVVKFFPAEAMGGLKVLKALAGPFSQMRFIPTGGISPSNLGEYLAFDKIIACGGSWMVPDKSVDNDDFCTITELAKEAVSTMLDAKIAHIGINSKDDKEALKTADMFVKLLNVKADDKPVSYFVSNEAEIMKGEGKGTLGHIAIGVTDTQRAIRYYRSQGLEFDESTIKTDETGRTVFVYFKDEVGGFAVHLVG